MTVRAFTSLTARFAGRISSVARALAAKLTIIGRYLKWDESLTSRAKRGERDAIETMFQTFVGTEEKIHACAYLGVRGLWGFGHHCWAAVTERRFSTILVSPFRGVRYQDIFADRIDRVQFHQPSGLVYLAFALGGVIFFPGINWLFDEDIVPLDPEIHSGWDLLVVTFIMSLCLAVTFYVSLAIARRFIKRGIECKSRNICVDAYCDVASTAEGLKLMRQIAHLREHRLKMVLAAQ